VGRVLYISVEALVRVAKICVGHYPDYFTQTYGEYDGRHLRSTQ
jgi:hypothetical protein